MKIFLKNSILFSLHLIRKMITVILNHAIPYHAHSYPHPRPSYRSAFERYNDDELRDSYNHFKKYFHDAIFLEEVKLRDYAIRKAISNHKSGYYYIEFGVWSGSSINQFSKILKDIKIYGFDSFEGLHEDWVGSVAPKGAFSMNKKPPRLNDHCVPIIGWIQDTLPKFIFENKDLKINFVHIDTDTYPTAKFILQQIKPYLINGSIIIFDEIYNFPGWRVGEYKALVEVFKEEEYKFLAFSDSMGAIIQYKKL